MDYIFIIPINKETSELFLSLPNTPFVGLIHKENRTVVLAPCIRQKVCLKVNKAKEIIGGTLIDDNFEAITEVNPHELNQMKALYKQNHLPRLLSFSEWDGHSAHELLFNLQCQSTKQSEWGGFSITLDEASDTLNYTFVSGAFNSEKGKRTRKAILSNELIEAVKQETRHLVRDAKNIVIERNEALPEIQEEILETNDSPTRPQKRQYAGSFFSDEKKPDSASSYTKKLKF